MRVPPPPLTIIGKWQPTGMVDCSMVASRGVARELLELAARKLYFY
jgi:hypothetical protein